MKSYLRIAIRLCKISRTKPSFLLHPLDLIGGDQIKELEFFPGMNINSKDKVSLFFEIINELKRNFSLIKMSDFANGFSKRLNDSRLHFTYEVMGSRVVRKSVKEKAVRLSHDI